MRSNNTYLGNGVHADGIYFTNKNDTASGYAVGNGKVMKACLDSNARIVDISQLDSLAVETEIYDKASLALYEGYNVIKVRISSNEDYYIALDRSSLVFEDVNNDAADDAKEFEGLELADEFNGMIFSEEKTDRADFPAAAVLVIKDGKILCASRSNGEGLCGPGGKVEDWETDIKAAAIREAQEEFGITPHNLIPLGEYKASSDLYMDSMVYLTDEFTGTPKADGSEMMNEQWLSLQELRSQNLFPPFEASLDMLMDLLSGK